MSVAALCSGVNMRSLGVLYRMATSASSSSTPALQAAAQTVSELALLELVVRGVRSIVGQRMSGVRVVSASPSASTTPPEYLQLWCDALNILFCKVVPEPSEFGLMFNDELLIAWCTRFAFDGGCDGSSELSSTFARASKQPVLLWKRLVLSCGLGVLDKFNPLYASHNNL
jgi:hypothetical protein